jgi:hypothetical protein
MSVDSKGINKKNSNFALTQFKQGDNKIMAVSVQSLLMVSCFLRFSQL